MSKANLSALQVLESARAGGYAVGAFNAANFEVLRAIVQAARNLRAPVIIETSEGETEYITPRVMAAMVRAYREKTGLPILLNLDHAHSFRAVEVAANAGYQLLHYDGSGIPYEKNVAVLKKVVKFANLRGDLVEGEMDRIVGQSRFYPQKRARTQQEKGRYTDVKKAVEFVKDTEIDIFAVFVGNVHGVYRDPPQLDFKRLREIRDNLDCFLSLHGGSGIRSEDIKKVIQIGKVVKINVNTELRMAYQQTLTKVLQETDEAAVYKFMPPVIKAVQKVVEKKIKLFGSEDKADA